MKILIIVSGEHIQGRLILSGLLKNSFNNIFLIKEENTKLAKKHDDFLKEISLKVPFFCNMTGSPFGMCDAIQSPLKPRRCFKSLRSKILCIDFIGTKRHKHKEA